MSARRKHVRAHARDVEVEVDLENGDRVCRVEEIKGGNVIEVSKQTHQFVTTFSSSSSSLVSSGGAFVLCRTNSNLLHAFWTRRQKYNERDR